MASPLHMGHALAATFELAAAVHELAEAQAVATTPGIAAP